MASQGTQSQTPLQQQEHGQPAIPSHLANHTASLKSSAQPSSQTSVGLQHFQQRQEDSLQGVFDSGALAQPAQCEGTHTNGQQATVAAAQQAKQEASASSIDVVLPHNTLVIMWPPMQEAWKHEVMTRAL